MTFMSHIEIEQVNMQPPGDDKTMKWVVHYLTLWQLNIMSVYTGPTEFGTLN